MNPATFSNVGATGMVGGPNAQPQNHISSNGLQRLLLHRLQSQGPFTGWRAEVPPAERALKAYNMITSLKLIQPKIDANGALQAALTFEEKVFREANQKEDYERECTNKLLAIRDSRQRHHNANVQSGIMQQHGGATGGMPGGARPNQLHGQFTSQMTRPMQASPIPGQMPVHMGMSDPSLMQPQHPQQQALAQNQMGQQRLVSGMPMNDELSMLTQAEYDQVCELAAQFIEKIPPEEREKRKMNISRTLNNDVKQVIAQKHGDPLTYMMRLQTARRLRNRANPQMLRAPGLDQNNPIASGDALLNNVAQRQIGANMMGLQRTSALQLNNQPNIDSSGFLGNVENIQGQQADGLRSQEAGQLVVPASNASMMNQQTFAPTNHFQPGATSQHGQNGQSTINRSGLSPQQFLTQQQLQNAQNAQQERLQQTTQFQAQNQVQNPTPAQVQAQARAQAAHNAKMAMSAQSGGQNSSQLNQNITHQSPAMSMLNRPVGPNMSPAQAAAQGRPQSRPPGVAGQQPNAQQQAMRAQIPPNLPPALQERLAQMPPEQVNAFLMAQQRRALANSQARVNGQSMSLPTNVAHPSQNAQFNDSAMRTSMAVQPPFNGMAGGQQNNPMIQGQQMSIQQQQQLLRQQQMMRPQNRAIEMSQEQINQMDRMPFPPSMLNSNSNLNPPLPKTVKTWGQLKEWVLQNPQVLGNVDVPKLLHLQRLHLAQTLSQQREAGRTVDPNSQANWAGHPQQLIPGQNPPGGHSQPSMPSIPLVTPGDILMAREKLGPQAQNVTDDQIKALIMRNRQRAVMQQLQAPGLSAQTLNQNQAIQQASQSRQMPVQNPAAPKQSVPPLPTTIQVSQQAQKPQPANAKSQSQTSAPTAGRNAKAGAANAKSTSKKRPASDDVIEVPNPKIQQTSQAPSAQPAMASTTVRPPLPFTREQLASLPPQRRAQVEAQMRRQSRPPQVTKAAAEENWNNNLPDNLKHAYAEMAKVVANSEPVNISSEDKASMAQQLRESTDMLSRMDTLVQWMVKMPDQDKYIKPLFSLRIQLMRQFKGSDWSLKDEFTILPEFLRKAIGFIKNIFTSMIQRVQSQQRPKFSNAQAPNAQSNVTPLNASNLEQLQQQEEAKRARRVQNQAVPAAPTASQPPFPLGDPSPQGVPQAYGPGGFSPDKLKLPPTKRRKQSHPATPATPVTPTAPSKAEVAKPYPFKCSVADCEYHHKGFTTQAELDKHLEEDHKTREQIANPVKYALDSLNHALGVPAKEQEMLETKDDQNPTTVDASLVNAKPISSQMAKQEAKAEGATPATAGTTPMGRVLSQMDAKSASPISNQLLTPRLTASKASKAAIAKQALGKNDKEASKTVDQPIESEDKALKNGWVHSAMSLDIIQDAFDASMSDELLGFGGDLFDEFVNADMFMGQSEDTPDSVDSSGIATQTPKDGDMVKEDTTIKINSSEDDGLFPSDWYCHPGLMLARGGNDDPWSDWEALTKESLMAPFEENMTFSVP